MGDSCVETSEAPAWLLKLEKQREKLSKARLGHDSGAGAPCNSCGNKCPGLDLHFWRKVCRACHCSKDVHDVQDDDLSGWAQFQLLGTTRPQKASMTKVKIKGLTEEPVKVDWVPPDAPPELVCEYMGCLGALAPVSGSEAARRRRANLRQQLPAHDVAPAHATHASPAERRDHEEYVARVRGAAAGRGRVVRVHSLRRLVAGVALRPAGAAPPDPPGAAPPPAAALGVGPARLHSALAHPELYDAVGAALARAGLDAAADEWLGPVLRLRERVRRDPALLAALGPPPPRADATEGFLFGLGGELWAWRRDDDDGGTGSRGGVPASALRCGRVEPQYGVSGATPAPRAPQRAQPLHRAPPSPSPPALDAPPAPPPPNYATYPGPAPQPDAEPAPPPAVGAAPAPFAGMSAEEAAEFDRRLHAEGVPCRRCGEAMFAGSVAVWAARAGAGAVWHPRCFTCARCGELLADLVYSFVRGEVYCARDLAAVLEVPRCAGCDELIFARPYTAAEGRAYHVQHFCCYRCDAPLGGGVYVPDERAGLPVCVPCFERHSAERCAACSAPIGPQQQGVSLAARHWHAECFACGGCSRSLLSGKFTVKHDVPYCSVQCVRDRLR